MVKRLLVTQSRLLSLLCWQLMAVLTASGASLIGCSAAALKLL